MMVILVKWLRETDVETERVRKMERFGLGSLAVVCNLTKHWNQYWGL